MSDGRTPPDALGVDVRPTDTAAVVTALTELAQHLRRPRGRDQAPSLLVRVVGRQGMGKSYLLGRLAQECEATRRILETDEPTTVAPVVLSGADRRLEDLYVPFVDALQRTTAIACVLDLFAEIVADLLTGDPDLATTASVALRRSATSPRERADYIASLGIPDATVRERLRDRIAAHVADDRYALALSLLVRDGLDKLAWEWMRGASPAPSLVELGINYKVPGGVQGMSVLARLLARSHVRLVVLFDDYDRLVGGERDERWLWSLLDAFASSGAAAFLTSRADPLENRVGLPSRRILLAGLDRAQSLSMFTDLSPTHTWEPFDRAAVERLVDLAEGRPQSIRELRERLLQTAGDGPIDEAQVVEGTRRFFSAAGRARAAAAVRRVLDANQWRFRHPRAMGFPEPLEIDFWVYSDPGDARGGCGIVVADVILDVADVDQLTAVVDAVRVEEPSAPLLLVVLGPTSSRYAGTLSDLFGSPPLSADSETFGDDLAVAVKGMLLSEAADAADDRSDLRRRLDRLSEIQDKTLDLVGQLSSDVQRIGERAPSPATGPFDQVFDRALRKLRELGDSSSLVEGLFEAGTPADRAVTRLRRLNDSNTAVALGVAEVLAAVIEEFRDAVRRWANRRNAFNDGDTPHLEQLCDRYAEQIETLRLSRMSDLRRGEVRGRQHAASRIEDVIRDVSSLDAEVRRVAEVY